ncbi:MAG TPA: SGNH/GDSL hydrolase family protein [Mucilaginibacter sp.]|nr:SGNH/GDSL hydrolase family protein [Mucilaginibacter sp.]
MRKIIYLTLLSLTATASFAQDWPELARYHAADEKIKQDQQSIKAVFMGDSITDYWLEADSAFFRQNDCVDRGIGGQTSPQMLLRFRQDVIELKPKVVVILCGTNDLAGNTGPMTPEMTESNIMSMAELARANKVRVVLCSILPADHFGWRPDLQPADSIINLNSWIKTYAKQNHLGYLDYYSALVNDRKGMKKEYSEDGVHPNQAGYAVMEPLVKAELDKR